MAAYCVYADLVPFLPSGGLPNPARTATGRTATDAIESEGHGLALDGQVTFEAATGGALPAPLAEGTTYYAIPLSPSRFSVSLTSGGTAINLTTDGENFQFAGELPWAQWMEWGARQIDGLLPAHVVPVVPDTGGAYPPAIVIANADLAATLGLSKTGGATIDLDAKIESIRIRLKDWAKSLPLRGVAASRTSPVNLAITSTAGAADPRGWATCGNDRIP